VLARWHAECSQRLPAGVEARVVVSFGVNGTTHATADRGSARTGGHAAH
jgi:hypothetical protein